MQFLTLNFEAAHIAVLRVSLPSPFVVGELFSRERPLLRNR